MADLNIYLKRIFTRKPRAWFDSQDPEGLKQFAGNMIVTEEADESAYFGVIHPITGLVIWIANSQGDISTGDITDWPKNTPEDNWVFTYLDGEYIWAPVEAVIPDLSILDLTDTPDAYGTVGQVLRLSADGQSLEWATVTGGGGAGTFLELADTPSSFGPAGSVPVVNSTSTALDWGTVPQDFTDLGDTPVSYASSTAGQAVVVNSSKTGLTFADVLSPGDLPDIPETLLDLTDTPNAYGRNNQALVVNSSANGTVWRDVLTEADLPDVPENLIELNDTPNGYGTAGQALLSNGTSFVLGDVLTEEDLPDVVTTFIGLTDTPSGYGTAGQYVTTTGSSITYTDAPVIPDPVEPSDLVSADDGNLIEIGDDGKLVVNKPTEEYHVNLQFNDQSDSINFFIPPQCVNVVIPVDSIAGDNAAVYNGIIVQLTSTYTISEITPLDVGTTRLNLTDQAGHHVTATVTAGWPDNVGQLSLDMVFRDGE